MMDGSGSLNGPGGVDPGGTQRMKALYGIRDILSGETRVRIALYSFDEEARRHADFDVASAQHPSDAAIQASLGGERYTDYGKALDAVLEAFGRAQEGSCRVMVWFTDGLHDPEPGYGPDELEGAKAQRTQACRSTKPAFEEAGIKTFAVLLGRSFSEGLSAANDSRRTMAEISMDVIRGFTGHHDSPAVEGVPTVPECDWGDQRAGEILTVAGVNDLASGLLKSIVGVTHVHWQDCERLRDGSRVNSNDLPAGEFIEEIVVLAFGANIDRYGLLDAASAVPTSTDWQPLPDGSRQFRLEAQDIRGLPAGWGLVLEVQPDDGKDSSSVTLECYSKKVSELEPMSGKIVDEQGDRLTVVPAESTHTLRVDMHPYECPVGATDFVLMPADSDPPLNSSEPVRGGGCEQGPMVDFEFYSGRPDRKTRVTAFEGDLEPPFAANLWGRDSKLEVRVATDFEIEAVTTPGRPWLDCESGPQLDGDWLNGKFRGRSETACRVNPPADGSDAEGTGTVSVDEPSGEGAFHIETPDGPVDGDLPVAAGDLPLRFWVVSDGTGAAETAITLVWDGQSPQTESVPPLPGPPFACDNTEPRLHGEWRANEYSGRIVAATCTVHRPAGNPMGSAGSIEVETLWGGVRYYIETRGTRLEGSLELVFDDLPREFSVISGPIRSQGPWELGGEVDITLEPPPGNPRARVRVAIPSFDPLADYPAWPRLECDDPTDALEPTNAADGEVPEAPVTVEAPCEAIGPGMGELRLSLAWAPDAADQGEAGLPESLDWQFADGPGLDGRGRTLALQPGEDVSPLVLASAEPLPNDRIEGAGTVTVAAVWLLPWQQHKNIAAHNLPVEVDLRARSNPWLAALLVLIGAALTYALLYAIMARSIRLPPAGSFFGTRLEFKIERRPTGFRSRQLEGFETDGTAWSKVSGDRRHLRLSDLRIDAERPSWWQISSIRGLLNGGWGKPSRDAGAAVFGARPAGSPSQPGTTPAYFNELAVVALGTGVSGSSDEPEGIAYLLVPKKASERSLDRGNLSNLLRGMTPRYDEHAAAGVQPSKDGPAGPAPDEGPDKPPPAPGGPAKPPPLPPKTPPAPGGPAKPPPKPPPAPQGPAKPPPMPPPQ